MFWCFVYGRGRRREPPPSLPPRGRRLEWAVAEAGGGRDGSQGCRDGGHKDFENYFPDFAVFHGGF